MIEQSNRLDTRFLNKNIIETWYPYWIMEYNKPLIVSMLDWAEHNSTGQWIYVYKGNIIAHVLDLFATFNKSDAFSVIFFKNKEDLILSKLTY